MPLQELPNWQCCGATFPLATDNSMALIAPTRMLTETQKAGGHTTTLCAICYHVLRRTQVFLERHPEALERINWFTEEPYDGKARISHFLELLRDDLGWDGLAEHVVRPLTHLKVAPYYGCLLLRPQKEIGLDDQEEPTILHDCLASLGCEVVDFPYEVECCGSYLAVSKPEVPERLSLEIIASARRNGAQAVVTACPLCQFNLDHAQRTGEATAGFGPDGALPILYFTQLMAVALGLSESTWGLGEHYVDPTPLFASVIADT
jgi:heterodisulfide reductase subunit B